MNWNMEVLDHALSHWWALIIILLLKCTTIEDMTIKSISLVLALLPSFCRFKCDHFYSFLFILIHHAYLVDYVDIILIVVLMEVALELMVCY